MATHVRALGALHAIFGGVGILFGLVVLLFFGGLAGLVGMTNRSEDAFIAIPILGGIGGVVFIVALLFSLPSIIAAIGLLQFRSWGRTWGLVISAIDLIHVPLGTALGLYGLWVLLSPGTEQLFRRPAGGI